MAPDYTKYIYFLLKRGTKTKFTFFLWRSTFIYVFYRIKKWLSWFIVIICLLQFNSFMQNKMERIMFINFTTNVSSRMKSWWKICVN